MRTWAPVYLLVVHTLKTGHGSVVSCPSCGQDTDLTLVVVHPFVVLWCPCGHTWVDPCIDLACVLRDVPGTDFALNLVACDSFADALDRAERDHPGVRAVVDGAATADRQARHRHASPTAAWARGTTPAGPDSAQARRLVDGFHAGADGNEVVLVPMLRRELNALLAGTSPVDPVTPFRALLRSWIADFVERAAHVTAHPEHGPLRVIDAHRTGIDAALRAGSWLDDLEPSPDGQ